MGRSYANPFEEEDCESCRIEKTASPAPSLVPTEIRLSEIRLLAKRERPRKEPRIHKHIETLRSSERAHRVGCSLSHWPRLTRV